MIKNENYNTKRIILFVYHIASIVKHIGICEILKEITMADPEIAIRKANLKTIYSRGVYVKKITELKI